MKIIEHVEGNPPAGGAYSSAVVHAGLVHIAGHVGRSSDGERPERVEEEIALAIDNFQRTMEAAGARRQDLISVTCLLADIDDFPVFDAVYRTRFRPPYAARATYGVALAGGLRFELLGIAALPTDAPGALVKDPEAVR